MRIALIYTRQERADTDPPPFCFYFSSRLGCQVKITKELDGMVAQLPSATRNMYVDGE